MEKISPVSTNLLYNYKSQQNNNSIENKNTGYTTAPEILKKDTADAVKAYAFVQPPKKQPIEKEAQNFDEYKAFLTNQGKVEGKDFEIEQDYGSEIILLKNGKPVKEFVYRDFGDSKGKLVVYREIAYPLEFPSVDNKESALKSIHTVYGADGKFHYRTSYYAVENSPYKNENVNANTKSSDFKKYLKDNNIKFAADIDVSDNVIIHKYTTFDPASSQVVEYEFFEGEDGKPISVHKTFIDKDGNADSAIYFDESTTSYTEYTDHLIY